MPRIVDEFGIPIPLVQTIKGPNLKPDPSIAWTMDPFSQVPDEYRHLVSNPNEDSNTDAQEEEQ